MTPMPMTLPAPATPARRRRGGASPTRQAGFTLVEMATAITVLALVLLVAVPSIGGWQANMRIRNAAESLQTGLQTARMEALRTNRNVSFHLVSLTDPYVMDNSCALSASSGSWVVAVGSPAGACGSSTVLAARAIGDAGGKVSVSAGHSDDNVDKSVLGDPASTVTFNGFGRVAGAAAVNRIRVTGTGADTYVDLMLIVDAGGGVRMCDPRSSIAADDPRKC